MLFDIKVFICQIIFDQGFCHLGCLRETGDHIAEEDEAVMEEHRPVVPEDVTQRGGGGGGLGQGETHHRHSGEGDRVQLRHRGEILAVEK